MFTHLLRTLLLGSFLLILVVTNTNAGDGHKHNGSHSELQATKNSKINLQTICPVTGQSINKDIFADHDGKRVYFADKSSRKKFVLSPAPYISETESAGITLYQLQTKCPVSGEPIERSMVVEHEGSEIFVCCKQCRSKVRKNPGGYAKELAEQGVILKSAESSQVTEESTEPHEGSHNHGHHDHQH